MSRNADGSGRCSYCKSRFVFNRKDQKYCSSRCRIANRYRKGKKIKFCIVCKARCDRKYCSLTCRNLIYKLKRNRKVVERISGVIRARRYQRRENRKRGSTFISTRGLNINHL